MSQHISRKQAANTRAAILLAEKLGRPLNQFVTINFSMTPCPPGDVSPVFAKLRRDYFAKWIKRSGDPATAHDAPTFLWVIENRAGRFGAHWLVHIPRARLADFTARLPRWVEAVTGGPPQAGAIHIRAADTPHGARKYMLKGMDPAYAALYRIRPDPQGAVIGKRFGYSVSIGPSQCRCHGTKARWYRPAAATAAPAAAGMT